jgi:hypothetical protein
MKQYKNTCISLQILSRLKQRRSQPPATHFDLTSATRTFFSSAPSTSSDLKAICSSSPTTTLCAPYKLRIAPQMTAAALGKKLCKLFDRIEAFSSVGGK